MESVKMASRCYFRNSSYHEHDLFNFVYLQHIFENGEVLKFNIVVYLWGKPHF